MIARDDLTWRVAVTSLRSTCCPACGGAKKARQSLCATCYYKLPRGLQRDLYQGIGEGYEDALFSALTLLRATEFHTERKP